MKLYLDNCCFNRPYDEQRQTRIRLETQAKLEIQDRIRMRKIGLVWSFMLDFENGRNLNTVRKHEIHKWASYAEEYQLGDQGTLELGRNFEKIGFKRKDALHLACAVKSHCDYFITTDDGILSKATKITQVSIINPVDFFTRKPRNT